jgi:hypothetical protein
MRDTQTARLSSRFLGFVQVQVGARVFALPVQAVHFTSENDSASAGGLFEEAGEMGILVSEDASPADVQAQIVKASAEAVRELSKRYLN